MIICSDWLRTTASGLLTATGSADGLLSVSWTAHQSGITHHQRMNIDGPICFVRMIKDYLVTKSSTGAPSCSSSTEGPSFQSLAASDDTDHSSNPTQILPVIVVSALGRVWLFWFVLESGVGIAVGSSRVIVESGYSEAYTSAQLLTPSPPCGSNQLLVVGTDCGVLIGVGLCEMGLHPSGETTGSPALELFRLNVGDTVLGLVQLNPTEAEAADNCAAVAVGTSRGVLRCAVPEGIIEGACVAAGSVGVEGVEDKHATAIKPYQISLTPPQIPTEQSQHQKQNLQKGKGNASEELLFALDVE